MGWNAIRITALNVSGRACLALKTLEQQADTAPCEIRQLSAQLDRLDDTSCTVQDTGESPPWGGQQLSVKILQIKRASGVLKEFLSKFIAVPKWQVGLSLDPHLMCQSPGPETFFVAVTTLDLRDIDKQQLQLDDIHKFLSNFEATGNFTLSASTQPSGSSPRRSNKRKSAVKCEPDANFTQQEPPPRKKRKLKKASISTSMAARSTSYPKQGPTTRSMAEKEQEEANKIEFQERSPESSTASSCISRNLAAQSETAERTKLKSDDSQQQSDGSNVDNDLYEQFDRLRCANDRLIKEAKQLEIELCNDLAGLE